MLQVDEHVSCTQRIKGGILLVSESKTYT